MIYTVFYVSESGSFGTTPDRDIEVCKSLKEVRAALEAWAHEHEQYGSSASYASLHVSCGRFSDLTDVYPDFVATLGPRGGFVRCPC